jgi:hypothetical protein
VAADLVVAVAAAVSVVAAADAVSADRRHAISQQNSSAGFLPALFVSDRPHFLRRD